MMLMLMLLSVGDCYVGVGGYGKDREYNNDHEWPFGTLKISLLNCVLVAANWGEKNKLRYL